MQVKIKNFFAISLLMLMCACSLTKETTGEYVDDTAITSKVKYSLSRHLGSEGLNIHVETFKKTVQLSGFVTDYNIAERAAKLAAKVHNVESVKNNIQVKSNSRVSKKSNTAKAFIDDSKITADIKQVLLREKETSSQAIHVVTNNGEVTLSGTVRSHSEAATAEKIVKKVSGVKKVNNKLVI